MTWSATLRSMIKTGQTNCRHLTLGYDNEEVKDAKITKKAPYSLFYCRSKN